MTYLLARMTSRVSSLSKFQVLVYPRVRAKGAQALPAPSVAHLTVSLYLCSSGSKARGPEKGAVSAQKALRGSETETRELLGGTEENSVSPMRSH